MKHFIINTSLVVVALCLGALIGEGLLVLKNRDMKNYDIEMWHYGRLLKIKSADPVLGHEHRINAEAMLQSVQIRTNNFGMRGPDIQVHCPKNRRVLFLGTSGTMGWGVPEEKTLPARIAAGLGDDVEVLNAGIGNYNTVRYVQLFMTRLAMLDPTDIVINYSLNDARAMKPEIRNWLISHSQLAVTIWTAWNAIISLNEDLNLVSYYKSLYTQKAPGYQAMLNALDRISAYALPRHIRLYFLITPDFYYSKTYPYRFFHNMAGKEAVKRGFRYLDILPAFKGIGNPKSMWVMPTDHHLNERANQLMADYCFNNNFFTQ